MTSATATFLVVMSRRPFTFPLALALALALAFCPFTAAASVTVAVSRNFSGHCSGAVGGGLSKNFRRGHNSSAPIAQTLETEHQSSLIIAHFT